MEYKFETLVQWDTELYADSVEWCPLEPFKHVFVCGTYQLKENELTTGIEDSQSQQRPSRHGRLYLMSLVQSDQVIEWLQTIETSGILDCKWAPRLISNSTLLAVANANGQLNIYSMTEDKSSNTLYLKQITLINLPKHETDSELLTLSLNWSVGDHSIKIATSDSKGRISVFQLDNMNLYLELTWTAHSFEAWIVNFNPFNSQICYTGGDDCKMQVYDLRSELSSAKITKSNHSSGVTSLVCPLKDENLLLSGSYDEQVLLWDLRKMKQPLNSVSVGGGVWRIRFKPQTEELILVACMYNGFRIIDLNLQILSDYTEAHQSIAYGADWCHISSFSDQRFSFISGSDSAVTATCSFYDHKLCVSLVEKLVN